jgi:hypothetical protein
VTLRLNQPLLACPGCGVLLPLGAGHACATHSWTGACDRCAALEAALARAEKAIADLTARCEDAAARLYWLGS